MFIRPPRYEDLVHHNHTKLHSRNSNFCSINNSVSVQNGICRQTPFCNCNIQSNNVEVDGREIRPCNLEELCQPSSATNSHIVHSTSIQDCINNTPSGSSSCHCFRCSLSVVHVSHELPLINGVTQLQVMGNQSSRFIGVSSVEKEVDGLEEGVEAPPSYSDLFETPLNPSN